MIKKLEREYFPRWPKPVFFVRADAMEIRRELEANYKVVSLVKKLEIEYFPRWPRPVL